MAQSCMTKENRFFISIFPSREFVISRLFQLYILIGFKYLSSPTSLPHLLLDRSDDRMGPHLCTASRPPLPFVERSDATYEGRENAIMTRTINIFL